MQYTYSFRVYTGGCENQCLDYCEKLFFWQTRKRGATAILRAPQRVPSLTPTVTSWEFFRRSYQGLKNGCPWVTLHVPGGRSPELEPICMCFTPALFFLTSLPHSVGRRQLPQSLWGTIRDSGVLSDLPRVALSYSSQGIGCAIPPDAGGALG